MRLSNQIIETAFHAQGESAYDKADRLESLVHSGGVRSIIDRAARASVGAYEALLVGYNPQDTAAEVYRRCQEISLDAFCQDEPVGEDQSKHEAGMSSEVAVHGLLWWGILNRPNFGRYARFTSSSEDASTRDGKKNGFDLLLRTEKRRHSIQVKSNFDVGLYVDRYNADIIVVSTPALLGDPDATTNDMHEALISDDRETLNSSIARFIQELHTQKATNGRRKVI